MNHLTCRIVPMLGLVIFRVPGEIIGEVREVNGEPTIIFHNHLRNHQLTFIDIKIIHDNWNEFAEKRTERLKKPGCCPECGMVQGHYPFCQQA